MRELAKAERRADAMETWARGLVNSVLTARGHSGVSLPASPTAESRYTPPPMLPDIVQGWTQDEFIDLLTSEGKSRGEAIEEWKAAQTTGKFPYQKDEEFLT